MMTESMKQMMSAEVMMMADGGVEEEGGADPTLSLRGCTVLPLTILTTRPDT